MVKKDMFKGWKTLIFNFLVILTAILGGEDISNYVEPQHLLIAQALANVVLRTYTKGPMFNVNPNKLKDYRKGEKP